MFTGLFSRGLIIQFLLFAICMAVFSCACQSVALAQFDDEEYTTDDGGTVGVQTAPSVDNHSSTTKPKSGKKTWWQQFWGWIVALGAILFGTPFMKRSNWLSGGRINQWSGGAVDKLPPMQGILNSMPPQPPAPEKPKENPDDDGSDKEKKDKEDKDKK